VVGELDAFAALLGAAFALELAGEDLAAGEVEPGDLRDESGVEQLLDGLGAGWGFGAWVCWDSGTRRRGGDAEGVVWDWDLGVDASVDPVSEDRDSEVQEQANGIGARGEIAHELGKMRVRNRFHAHEFNDEGVADE
jgi:hypothetical protein